MTQTTTTTIDQERATLRQWDRLLAAAEAGQTLRTPDGAPLTLDEIKHQRWLCAEAIERLEREQAEQRAEQQRQAWVRSRRRYRAARLAASGIPLDEVASRLGLGWQALGLAAWYPGLSIQRAPGARQYALTDGLAVGTLLGETREEAIVTLLEIAGDDGSTIAEWTPELGWH